MVKLLDKNQYYKYMFLIAAAWNWIIAIVMFLLSVLAPSSAEDFGTEIPPTWFFFESMFFFVFLFGLLFYVTAKNLEKYHALATIFVIEKVGIFIVSLVFFLIGDINIASFLIAVGDLIFGILFLEFLANFE